MSKISTIEWFLSNENLPKNNEAILLWREGDYCEGGSFIYINEKEWSFRSEDGSRCKDVIYWAYYPNKVYNSPFKMGLTTIVFCDTKHELESQKGIYKSNIVTPLP